MADKGIPVAEATSGVIDKIDSKTVTNGIGETVQRQRVTIADAESNIPTAQVDFGDHTSAAVTDPAVVTSAATHMGVLKGILSYLKGLLRVSVTDGTNTMPTGDASARAIHVAIDADNTAALPSPFPVALSNGTDAGAVKAGNAEAAASDAAGVVTLRPSENHVGEVGGKSSIVKTSALTAPLTVTGGSAYSTGQVVGGLIDLGPIMRKNGGTGVLQSLLVTDHANQKAGLTILLFDAAPAATITDHTAMPQLSQADLNHLIRAVSVGTADYATFGSPSEAVADLSPGGRVLAAASGSQHLWMVIVTSGTPTYVNGTDLGVNLGLLLD